MMKINILALNLLAVFTVVFGFCAMGAGQVYAQSSAVEPEKYTAIRIIPEKNEIFAGEEIWVAIEYSIHPKWHTYWLNSGDSGAAANHNWSKPEGFEISDIRWPTPKEIPYPPLLNYGYEDQVILLQKLKASDSIAKGPLSFALDIDVLVCEEICIPEFHTLEFTLNGEDAEFLESDNSVYLDMARSKLPQKIDAQSFFTKTDQGFELKINGFEDYVSNYKPESLVLFPVDWGLIQYATSTEFDRDDGNLIAKRPAGDRNIQTLERVNALIAFETNEGELKSVEVEAQNSLIPKDVAAGKQETLLGRTDDVSDAEKQNVEKTGLLKALLLAFFGGLALNLMPCVFPVLSLKALSLTKMSQISPALARANGVSYTAGVMLSFLTIAAVLIAVQLSGAQVGWGFQLQNPIVISALAYLLFVIGLNLSGFFEISNSFGNAGQNLTQGDGLSGSFFTGVLATIVATPCTAPFMGVAIGYALLQPPVVSLVIFAALGFGLAFPYLLLSFVPALQKIMPRPGLWMDVFKQALAFPMYAFAAWLVWILAQQSDAFAVFGILLGMIAIVFAIWLAKVMPAKGKLRVLVKSFVVLSLLIPVALLPVPKEFGLLLYGSKSEIGRKFSKPALSDALKSDRPVFVEMTAAWCITCKVNHASSINIQSTVELFKENNVDYLIGDWTNYDAGITQYLGKFGRNGVPLYVFYGSPDSVSGRRPDPVILPQILTPQVIESAITSTQAESQTPLWMYVLSIIVLLAFLRFIFRKKRKAVKKNEMFNTK